MLFARCIREVQCQKIRNDIDARRMLLRNAVIASSEVHRAAFVASIRTLHVTRICCSASALQDLSTQDGVALAPLLLGDFYAASRLLAQAVEGSSCLTGTLPPARAQALSERVWT